MGIIYCLDGDVDDQNYLGNPWSDISSFFIPILNMYQDIYDVRKLFECKLQSPGRIRPLCRFFRDLCLSGNPTTRLAMTWAGQYVLMAEVSGVSILDPHQGGALMAVIRSSDLNRHLPCGDRSRILNIFCNGRVALFWVPTNRSAAFVFSFIFLMLY